ncbi:unnamed protein product [Clavelina lepadiformis]|uniref:TLC domain-containing protein n=1 Tax=Clavelina lepadiformis TaxID=159417 RepID=A0ABP0FHC8_CLALP
MEDLFIHVKYSGISFAAFVMLKYWVKRKGLIAKSVRQERTALWYNVVCSLTHSVACSILCTFCFYLNPKLAHPSQLQHRGMPLNRFISGFSLGYFLFDFFDTLVSLSVANSWAVLLHHIVVFAGFGVYAIGWNYYNQVIIAVLCEVNSVFLHVRQLLHLSGISRSSRIYRVNSVINLISHLLFRFGSFAWLTIFFLIDIDVMKDKMTMTALLINIFINILNVVLFYQLLRTDFLKPSNSRKIE